MHRPSPLTAHVLEDISKTFPLEGCIVAPINGRKQFLNTINLPADCRKAVKLEVQVISFFFPLSVLEYMLIVIF
jgi:hypothetical protein